MTTKHQIELGNCRTGLNSSKTAPVEEGGVKWDSTAYRFDSTIITLDRT